MADEATTTATTDTSTAAATTTAATAATTATTPWYQGKADTETIGHWDNKGWKKDDPAAIAIEATKQARELQKHFGVPADQLIKLPKDAADEAGWKGVYSRLGVPADAKEYDLAGVKRKSGADLDAALADRMRGALLGANVSKDKAPTVVKAVVEYLDATESARDSEHAALIATQRAELQKNWGTNSEYNRLQAMQGAKRLGLTPEGVAAIEGQIGYTNVMEALRKIGAGTTEDTFVEGGQGGAPVTRAGAVAKKAELMNDKLWADRYLKGGAAERREMDALNMLIAGEAA